MLYDKKNQIAHIIIQHSHQKIMQTNSFLTACYTRTWKCLTEHSQMTSTYFLSIVLTFAEFQRPNNRVEVSLHLLVEVIGEVLKGFKYKGVLIMEGGWWSKFQKIN